MPGILGFLNYAEQGTAFSVAVSDITGTGSADANNPASNAIDGRADTYFRRVSSTTCTLRLSFGRGFNNGLAIVGAIGVEAINAGTRLPVLVTMNVGTSAGASDIYSGKRRIVASGITSSLNAPANAFLVVDPMTTDDALAIGGSFSGTGSVYVDFICSNGGTLAEWRVRGIGAWQGFASDLKPNRVSGGVDLSEVLRSYAGAEFVNRRAPKRAHSATFNNMNDDRVYGGTIGAVPAGFAAGKQITANVGAVNWFAGTSRPVVFVPRADIGYSNYSDPFDSVGRNWNLDNKAQSEIAWGYLQKPLEAREVARVKTGGSQWEASFTLIEGYNGVV